MTKLSIGIGEDFPVEDKTGADKMGAEDCASRHRRHRHQHHDHQHHDPHSLHGRVHHWMHAHFARHGDNKDRE